MSNLDPLATLPPKPSNPTNERWSFDSWHILRFAGSALLIATGAIHLDLYLTGYRTIPTIGWLFLLQVISDFVFAGALIFSDLRLLSFSGAGLLLSTLVGYLLALRISLFGFREVRTTAGIVAGVIEILGFAALAAVTLRPDQGGPSGSSPVGARQPIMAQRQAMLAGRSIAAVFVVLATLSLIVLLPDSGNGTTGARGAKVTIKVGDIHGVPVLTNSKGYTLYWFKPDSPTASHCYGTCAAYWPPVVGSLLSSTGIAGTFSTVKRSHGGDQVTYNGHPLYTYVGDAAPRQASGNDVDLNGGYWYEMKVSSK